MRRCARSLSVRCGTSREASRPRESMLRKNTMIRKERSQCRCFEQANDAHSKRCKLAVRTCTNSNKTAKIVTHSMVTRTRNWVTVRAVRAKAHLFSAAARIVRQHNLGDCEWL